MDFVRDAAVFDLAVRRFEEAVLVGARVDRERIDEADVRAFRRLDRAYAAVMSRMHVAHLEPCALARQPARPERGNAPLVGDLGQRVGLVHELRKLARAEEFADCCRHRLGIDQIVRHEVLGLGLGQPFPHRALDAHQAGAELVLREFADRAHAAVAEMVDVVDFALAVAQIDQDLDHGHDVLFGQRCRSRQLRAADAAVEFHAADRRQVVASPRRRTGRLNSVLTASSVGGSPGRIMR